MAAETSQVHLHQRADDLSRQLEASLEKLSVYERRPNTTTNSVVPSHEGRSQEELLEAEVAELKYVSSFVINAFVLNLVKGSYQNDGGGSGCRSITRRAIQGY